MSSPDELSEDREFRSAPATAEPGAPPKPKKSPGGARTRTATPPRAPAPAEGARGATREFPEGF